MGVFRIIYLFIYLFFFFFFVVVFFFSGGYITITCVGDYPSCVVPEDSTLELIISSTDPSTVELVHCLLPI